MQRLQQLAYQKPQLMGGEYSHLDYCRRPMRKDVGKRMLYRCVLSRLLDHGRTLHIIRQLFIRKVV